MKLHRWLLVIVLGIYAIVMISYVPRVVNAACVDNSGLVLNGSFEQGGNHWKFYSDGTATFRVEATGFDCDHAALLQLDQPGKNTQFYQMNIALDPKTRYRLSFAAYSSKGNDLALYLHEHKGDYTNYGLSVERVDLSTSWQSFTFEFVTTGFQSPVSDGRLRFGLSSYAAAGEHYWIDGVVLTKVTGDGPSVTPTTIGTSTPPVAPTPTGQVPTATATRATGANTNPIVAENQQPGTTNWKLTKKANDSAGQIKGYASSTSVNKGNTIDFHISVDTAQAYTIDIYRMGWYQGKGGRLMAGIGPLQGKPQPKPIYDRTTGLIYCPWTASYTLRIPQDWTSGIYLAKLTNANNYQNYIVFVVRDDNRRADMLYQQTVMTYQAYNNYPHDQKTGKSFYEGASNGDNTLAGGKRAVTVSFDRPYSRDGSSKFFVWEYYFIRWIEQQGYDVAYSTNMDTHRNGERLLNYNAFVSSGHDEYWTYEMFDAAERARDRGVNLAFFGGNTIYWQVRMEPSSSGVQDRVMIGYKDVAKLDPIADRKRATDKWRNVGRPEQGLLGVLFPQGGIGNNTDYRVSNSSHWAYAGTGLQNNDKIAAIIGYEIDSYDKAYLLPAYDSYIILGASPFTGRKSKTFSANAILYETANNAKVFAGGTTSWSWGLDKPGYIDPRLQKMTANLLDNLGGSVHAASQLTPLTRPESLLSADELTQFDCRLTPGNLVRRADFETTAEGWMLSTQGQVYPATVALDRAANVDNQKNSATGQPIHAIEEGGCDHTFHLTGPAGQTILLYQDGIRLDAARQYRVRVALNATEPGMMSLYLVQPDHSYLNLGVANATFTVEPGWRQYFVEFLPTNFVETIDNARLLLLFYPNTGGAYAVQQANYWVDEISLTPIDYGSADDDPHRLYSLRDSDEETVATNDLAAHVRVAGDDTNARPAFGLNLLLQDLESGGLLYQDSAVTATDGRVLFTDVPVGEYLIMLQPESGYLTPEPLWVAVDQEWVNDLLLTVSPATETLYLPLINR